MTTTRPIDGLAVDVPAQPASEVAASATPAPRMLRREG
jgi:hypothetical protein